ncbi:methylmalonyl Co-A mutase-associated GTPase MeaB [Aciditerrimonas ferrireducens]|uniref:Methylmalonyl Co-A mutase-associated GTPase MeaB n=1 Tax=Aciditerrimonas ferrireducens TaxID=667306 RepID=A0ABV6C2L6_9ACTN
MAEDLATVSTEPHLGPGRLSRDPAELLDQAGSGNRRALARLLSLVEAGRAEGQALSALAHARAAGQEGWTVGITGAPGAGKSTLTSRLVAEARRRGAPRVAVVAVDPTSPFSGGAVLGDRVRMQDHAGDDGVFIRSMATRGHLGGLSVAVPEAIWVLWAAGVPLVLVETVGVGQVEVEVASATDTTVVVVNPKWGDAVQANKAGLMEVADVFVVNKADLPGAREARRDLEQMLDLAGRPRSGRRGEQEEDAAAAWRPPVVETVAADGRGVAELWAAIEAHQDYLVRSGERDRRRRARARAELERILQAQLARVVRDLELGDRAELLSAVEQGQVGPYEAARTLLLDAGEALRGQPGVALGEVPPG